MDFQHSCEQHLPDLTEEDVQDEEAEGGVEDEADGPLATGRHRDPYLHDDGLDEDFEELGDEDFLPSELVDEESLRHAHVKHHRASLTRKLSDELNKGFRSSQQRIGSDRSKAVAEQKQARSLKLRLQGQVCTAFPQTHSSTCGTTDFLLFVMMLCVRRLTQSENWNADSSRPPKSLQQRTK